PSVDAQPYIIISGRDTVENLKAEARRYAQAEQDEADAIQADKEYQHQSGLGGEIEVEAEEGGKTLYIIVYRKKTEQVESIDPTTMMPTMETKTTITASK